MLTCHDVANYFLSLSDEDAGDLISNLKLQKLVYYAQGFHLALFDKSLFKEEIEAWMHGPVIPDLYHRFKDCGSGAITLDVPFDRSVFTTDQISLLNDVYQSYGQYSAWKLRNLTHEEQPWSDVADSRGEITCDSMSDYFKTQLA